MRKMKCCPKSGSTNTNFLAFYRPLNLEMPRRGYEGAFIIEDGALAEKMQEHYQKKRNIVNIRKHNSALVIGAIQSKTCRQLRKTA